MIPKTAFAAIAALMAVCVAFGYTLRVVLDKAIEDRTGAQEEPDRHSCDTCKYEAVSPTKEPCVDCGDDDLDRWEAME